MNDQPGRAEHRSDGLLTSLSPATSKRLLQLGTSTEYVAGRVVLREGESSTHVILLLSGCVKVTATTQDGGLALLAIRAGGDLVGELAGLDGQPRSATVTTVCGVRARIITESAFHDFLAHHPDAALAVSRTVGAKLRWANRRRVDFSGCAVRARLAKVLIELAAAYGWRTEDGLTIGVTLTQPELAALVGAAEPTVHKALAELRRHHVIRTGYRRTTILDQRALRAVAGHTVAE
jgi:CRP-like cAMP-binding protein